MNTTRTYRNRRQRWLSPEQIQQKFAELRAMLRARDASPVLEQAEFTFTRNRQVGYRRGGRRAAHGLV